MESLNLPTSPNPINPNVIPPHASNNNQQNSNSIHGPLAILWDIENCPIPRDVRPQDVAGNIRMALRVHPVIKGAVTLFSAYGDFNAFPRCLREGCQRTGVKLVDVPNGRKDAADKAILVDMFLFALDNPPPSSILLISGDVDFAPALHILGQRGYTVILVIPAGVGVASALSNAGRYVWDWPSVARGEGFLPPKILMARGSAETSGYFLENQFCENPEGSQNEEEAIVYRGVNHIEYATQANTNQMCFYSRDYSRTSQSLSQYNSHLVMPFLSNSRSHSLPSGLHDVSIAADRNDAQDPSMWVQPGDINGLKGQLVKLLELSGGSLLLVRVPAEYHKLFGRPLYMAEYGVLKLVNLLKKMADTMAIDGKGHKKFVYLRNSIDRPDKVDATTTNAAARKDKKKKVMRENTNICNMTGCSSDEYSDDERGAEVAYSTNEFNERLEQFRIEVQELLVSLGARATLLTSFEDLYKQRYKKVLEYKSFGVAGLEELINKLGDVAVLEENEESKRKFIVPASVGG
ncbi:hypothetical protein Syun_014685 [Stephania yunnanensis]|uniref:HTH OST-type domain-containing protein n=1 Tax=Stephania yunnanensis TaxID=152371 RepID=A0AAP0PC31_9MAGN